MNPTDLKILEAGAMLRDGSLSAVALCEAHIERIEARDGALHAFVAVDAENALAEASKADQSLARGVDLGPLHGIPVGLKDLIDVCGYATANGSRVVTHGVAKEDAVVVRRLREAGAVILGKLATYEFALVGPSFDTPFPPVRNPWNLANITGGSSSGPAAAVAGGLLRTSIGTDSGGSIRSPAAYCGVVGLKPTFGLVPAEGVFPLSQSLDHVGPISASAGEAALTLDALVGGQNPSWRLAASRLGQPIDGVRIGYARDGFANDPMTHPEVLRAIDDAASQLSLLGARIEELTLPDYGLCEACGATILHFEALANHEELMRRNGDDYGRLAWLSLAAGVMLTPSDLARARRIAVALRDEIDSGAFARCDALLTASTLAPAPPFSAFDGRKAVWTPMRTLPFNVTGHPALTMPAGFAEGLPIGAQIVGRAFDEALLCQIADAFELATDFAATPRHFASDARRDDPP